MNFIAQATTLVVWSPLNCASAMLLLHFASCSPFHVITKHSSEDDRSLAGTDVEKPFVCIFLVFVFSFFGNANRENNCCLGLVNAGVLPKMLWHVAITAPESLGVQVALFEKQKGTKLEGWVSHNQIHVPSSNVQPHYWNFLECDHVLSVWAEWKRPSWHQK